MPCGHANEKPAPAQVEHVHVLHLDDGRRVSALPEFNLSEEVFVEAWVDFASEILYTIPQRGVSTKLKGERGERKYLVCDDIASRREDEKA